jgi:hypothetical protein
MFGNEIMKHFVLYNALKIKKIQKNVGKSSPYSKGEADTRT